MKSLSFVAMAFAAVMAVGGGNADAFGGNVASDSATIVGHIMNASGGQVQIHQPAELGERLKASSGNPDNGPKKTAASRYQVGYRIQVFADNNQRTAKGEAMSRKRQIVSMFPEMDCYLLYKAPSWRLRVGDFTSRDEAVEAMKQLKKAFPSFSREMIVVTDRIKVAAL